MGKKSVAKTVEHQNIIGGLEGATAEIISETLPVPVQRIGIRVPFGRSGIALELMKRYGLTSEKTSKAVREAIKTSRRQSAKSARRQTGFRGVWFYRLKKRLIHSLRFERHRLRLCPFRLPGLSATGCAYLPPGSPVRPYG